jgi:hypothetical protein
MERERRQQGSEWMNYEREKSLVDNKEIVDKYIGVFLSSLLASTVQVLLAALKAISRERGC